MNDLRQYINKYRFTDEEWQTYRKVRQAYDAWDFAEIVQDRHYYEDFGYSPYPPVHTQEEFDILVEYYANNVHKIKDDDTWFEWAQWCVGEAFELLKKKRGEQE